MNKFTISFFTLAVSLMFSANAMAKNMSKDEFNAAEKRIATEYKSDKEKCDSPADIAKDICQTEAKGKNKVWKAKLKAQYKPSKKATYEVGITEAEADYAVTKEKCNDKAGNDKDVCVKEAKAALIRGKADAKAQMKTSGANVKANEDTSDARRKEREKDSKTRQDATAAKRDADYKVEIEKCDKFAGDTKDQCVARAKKQFAK